MQQEIYVFRLADKIAEPQFFTLSFAPSTNRRYYIIRIVYIEPVYDHKDRYLRYDKP